MKNIKVHTGTLTNLTRLKSSSIGNARYSMKVNGIFCKTEPNSAIAISIKSYIGKVVTCKIGLHYNQPTIFDIKLVEGAKI